MPTPFQHSESIWENTSTLILLALLLPQEWKGQVNLITRTQTGLLIQVLFRRKQRAGKG